MPLTAVHATAGVLDLTTDQLARNDGADSPIGWPDLHRTRPRAPLACRECGHGLHAKVSRTGLRFFSHDAGAPECGLAGEGIAHRLLKMELASAIRAAGWHAELEVPGAGWRADVLATSPDGATRMAWEAQLAAATIDELATRTAAMAAERVTVCWVTDKDRPFIGHVPSIRIGGTEPDEVAEGPAARSQQTVIDGLGAFEPDWCHPRSACQIWAQHGYYGRDEGPCSGHGRWRRPETPLTLTAFVTHLLSGTVRLHEARTEQPWALGRHRPGKFLWTTRTHWLAEQDQIDATEDAAAAAQERAARHQKQRQRENDHLVAIARLEARQAALRAPAVELIGREARGYIGVRDSSPAWAMGVPLFVRDMPRAVIAPVASRVNGAVRERLAGLTIFVASPTELRSLARVCVPGQRIVLFDVPVDVPEVPRLPEGVTPRQAVSIMFGRRPGYRR